MKLYFITLLIIQTNLLLAQTVDFYGQSFSQSEVCSSLGFQDNVDAKNALDKICAAAGLVNNYVLMPCPNMETCLAILKDGIPMILYDNSFLKKIKSYGFSEKRITNKDNTNEVDWTSLTILAHELGHHVNQHFSKLRSGGEYLLKNELEADEFAGVTLYKLGASLEQTKSAYFSLPEVASFSHPSRSKRLEAIANGYNQASSKFRLNSTSYNNSLLYGNWKIEGGGVMSFQSNGTFQISEKVKLFSGYWNITNGKINLKQNSTDPGQSFVIQELTNYTLSVKSGESILTFIKSDESAELNYNNFYKENWKKFVYIGKFDFTYRRAGGIWDLDIPLINNSDRDIEYAQVKVEYIKDNVMASGGVYKTEYIEYKNLKAHSTMIIKAPDSDRGVDVRTTISKVRFKN